MYESFLVLQFGLRTYGIYVHTKSLASIVGAFNSTYDGEHDNTVYCQLGVRLPLPVSRAHVTILQCCRSTVVVSEVCKHESLGLLSLPESHLG